MTKKYTVLNYLCLLLISLSSIACGGGGSDSEDNTTPPPNSDYALDACNAVGLKVANGQACSVDAPSASPIVAVLISDKDGNGGTCTGTVIDTNVVLTAAHCFMDEYTKVELETTAGTLVASRVQVHPGFDVSYYLSGGVLVNDSALVFTDVPIGVAAAPLLLTRAPQVDEEAVVVGFGETFPGSGATTVHAGNALIADLTEQHVLVQYTGNQAHPCEGDSGGPLLVNNGGVMAIVGTVSQSDPSVEMDEICRPGDMTLYTNTQDISVLAFIAQFAPNAGYI